MKTPVIFLLAGLLLPLQYSAATNISFTLANAQIVNENGNLWYQVDVFASTTAAFKLGTGQVYFNYNTAAFGPSVKANAAIVVEQPEGSVLAQVYSVNRAFYGTFIIRDNTNSRVSFAWTQSLSAGSYPGNNILTGPTWLFRLHLKYLPGQTGQSPDVCFEQGPTYLDLQFTACGPFNPPQNPNSPDFSDCEEANASQQIFDDAFDCTVNALPIELADFSGEWEDKNARLRWSTYTELNNDYFQLERSSDGLHFVPVTRVDGAGTTAEPQRYTWLDTEIARLPGEHFYYRLRQVDFDGKENLSHMIVFTRDPSEGLTTKEGLYSVLPNPTTGRFQLHFDGKPEAMGDATARLYASDGRLISQTPLTESTTDFDLSNAAPGSYWIAIFNEKEPVQQLLVVVAR